MPNFIEMTKYKRETENEITQQTTQYFRQNPLDIFTKTSHGTVGVINSEAIKSIFRATHEQYSYL